jgi:hypothetical protein
MRYRILEMDDRRKQDLWGERKTLNTTVFVCFRNGHRSLHDHAPMLSQKSSIYDMNCNAFISHKNIWRPQSAYRGRYGYSGNLNRTVLFKKIRDSLSKGSRSAATVAFSKGLRYRLCACTPHDHIQFKIS